MAACHGHTVETIPISKIQNCNKLSLRVEIYLYAVWDNDGNEITSKFTNLQDNQYGIRKYMIYLSCVVVLISILVYYL